MVSTAIILAGGLGTRLRSVVSDVPKPMAPIKGRPFLAYQLDYWIAEGITQFILSVGYKYELIQDYFKDDYQGASIDYVIESQPLGTGGALLLAAEKLATNERFLLLNGDTYFVVDLKKLDDFARANNADWCFSLFTSDNSERYMSMDVSITGQIRALQVNRPRQMGLVNGGVYIVHPRSLGIFQDKIGKQQSLERDMFLQALLSEQRLFGLESEGKFIDIGIPEDYRLAASLLCPAEAK